MLKIAQISDCHLFADRLKCGYGQINPYQSLARVLTELACQPLDLLLVTGDVSADGSAQSYQHFSQLIKDSELACDFIILPGNHDDPLNLRQEFAEHNLWFSYDAHSPLLLANWHIHLLDTKTTGSGGALPDAALDELEQALARSTEHFHLLAAHHHPLPCRAWMDQHGWHNAERLLALLERYPRVKGMIYGHIHHASEQQRSHCHFMSCPSTCWQWAMQPQFGLSEQAPGYRLLELTPEGQLSTQIHRVELF